MNDKISPVRREITKLKHELARTDYVVLKRMEGREVENYEAVLVKRQNIRDKINELQDQLKEL